MKFGKMPGFRWLVVLLPVAVVMVAQGVTFAARASILAPELSIIPDPAGLRVAWPLGAADWVLERTHALQVPGGWTRVAPGSYESNQTHYFVGVGGLNESRFYRLRRPTVVPGLSGFWRFDEGAGNVAGDESSVGTSLVITNATWAPGRVGPAALEFNGGGNTRAWIDNHAFQVLPRSGEPFSVSLWFSPAELSPVRQVLIGGESNAWHVTLQTRGPATNELVFAGGNLTVTGRSILLPRQWYELTLTYDGVEGAIYLDHNLVARSSGVLPMSAGQIFVGGIPGMNSLKGRIDELRTYTNSLSADQIELGGWWDFNEPGGSVAFDRSPQMHYGQLLAGAARTPGKESAGIETSSGLVQIPNHYQTVLPPSGKPFSISAWVRPESLPTSPVGIMSSGWGLMWEAESGRQHLRFDATSLGGTLQMQVPVVLNTGIWSKLDITYNGATAAIYVNGRKLGSASGAIKASRGPFLIGGAPEVENFGGIIDDVRVFLRERDEAEIGPTASVMWETVFVNSSTNLVLQGRGPRGRALTYTITNLIAPTNGTVTHAPGSGVVTYQSTGRKGPDAFTYVVSDGEFTSAPATVTISAAQPHWISPAGGTVQPLDGSSPNRAWRADSWMALDAIWRTNQFYDCFFYAPGTYETSGWKYLERSTANPGCKHIGSGTSGPDASILKLVNAMLSWSEETIFGASHNGVICDNFEVHNLVLDCNAAGNPKYTRGEPITVRIPLTRTSLVDKVTFNWSETQAASRFGRAVEFSVASRVGTGAYLTNFQTSTATGATDVVHINTLTDELLLKCDRRGPNVDFYGMSEVSVSGAEVSLPTARDPEGRESRLDPETGDYAVVCAADGDNSTAWASGTEDQVEITFPLESGAVVSELVLHWNCRSLADGRQLGPAAEYLIRAREQATGAWFDVPFVRGPRTSKGVEANTFNSQVSADALMLVLLARDAGVHHYSLREADARNGTQPIAWRVPTALNSLGGYAILRAFDGTEATEWASATQGSVSAITLLGNNLRFKNLKISGFGTKMGRECFPIFIFFVPTAEGPRLGNITVEDCIFAEPATNNTDGVSVLTLVGAGGTLTNAIVRGSTVKGLRSWFTYSGAFGANHVETCLVEDCGRGVYFEPDTTPNVGSVLVQSNRFINVDAGVYLLSFPGRQFGSLACIGNEMVLRSSGGYGISSCDVCIPGPSGSITNVTALNNTVRFADWVSISTSPAGGILYSDFRHAVMANNIIALGTPNALRVRQCPAGIIPPPPDPQLCDDPPPTGTPGSTYPPCVDVLLPGYRRAWMNNRDLSGNLLDVKCIRWGVDGLAAEQQWVE